MNDRGRLPSFDEGLIKVGGSRNLTPLVRDQALILLAGSRYIVGRIFEERREFSVVRSGGLREEGQKNLERN